MLADTLKRMLPPAVKTSLRTLQKDVVLHQSLRRFKGRRAELMAQDHELLNRLIWAWGNSGWSGSSHYLSAAISMTTPQRRILECGTGLSTILMGLASRSSGSQIYSLEHLPEWSRKIREVLSRYHIDNVRVLDTPIISHGGYAWYDVSGCAFPRGGFDAVICDGPPSNTPGGRYGLMPQMTGWLQPDCAILLDDIERPEEQAIVRRWQVEFGITMKPEREHFSFARLAVSSAASA